MVEGMVDDETQKCEQPSSSQQQVGKDDEALQDNPVNSSSAADETTENNSENNINVAAEKFGTYSNASGYFGVSSKTTVANALEPTFPLSRKEAEKVSTERSSVVFVDSIKRKINGNHGLDVSVPLLIKENKVDCWLMYIYAKDQRDIFGILYNTTTGVVSCSEKALSTICRKADTGAVLNPGDVEKMDQACFEFLSTMRRKDDAEEKESEDGENLSCHYICLLFLIWKFLYYHYSCPRETSWSTTTVGNTTRWGENVEER